MTDKTHDDNDQSAERWLDSALDRYTDAEPRPGFETRLLASVATQREKQSRWRALWTWSALATTAAALIAVVALSVGRKHDSTPPQQVANGNPPAHVEANGTLPKARETSPKRPMVAAVKAPRRNAPRHMQQPLLLASSNAPKQSQFPTPEPLSEQERLLLAYMRATPREEIDNVIAEKRAFQKHVDSLGVPEEQEKSDR